MLKKRLLDRLKTRLRPRRLAQHGAPPPEFIRVAYCTPRQVVLITARHNGAENVWPIDWHVPLSMEPKLYGIAVNRASYGAQLIRASNAFVVNFVPATWEEAIFLCGRTSGRAVDKFAATGLMREEAESVDSPRLANTLGFLECRVEQVVETGDHTFIIGRITHEAYRASAPALHHLYGELATVVDTFR